MEFKSAVNKLLKSKGSSNNGNITLQLGDNPIQCDCHLLDFIKSTKRDIVKAFHKNIKLSIDDLNCIGPQWIAYKSVRNIDPKELKCIWTPTNEDNKDACSKICTCWQFPEEQKILADCSDRNLTHIPKLVGMYNNWTTELNFSGNRLELLPSLSNDEFKHIKALDLSNNSISSISTDIFSESLQVLELHDNKISKLDYSVIRYLEKQNTSLTNLSLYNNPWECDCGSEKLTEISTINNYYSNVEKARCQNYKEFLFKVNFTDLCYDKNSLSNVGIRKDTYYFPYEIFGLMAVLNFLVLIIFCSYYYQHNIKSFLFNYSWINWHRF